MLGPVIGIRVAVINPLLAAVPCVIWTMDRDLVESGLVIRQSVVFRLDIAGHEQETNGQDKNQLLHDYSSLSRAQSHAADRSSCA